MSASAKPRVLILGGLGFIGRNLVEYLATHNLVSKIRVADKGLPDLVKMSKKQTEIFKSELVECKQLNLSREAMTAKAFDEKDGAWDFVINLAGETRYSETAEVYKENVLDVSLTCAKAAAKSTSIKKYIEFSTAQVYAEGSKASTEESKLKPWTNLAKAKLEAEEEIKKLKGLNLVIVRPSIVYGPGDVSGITPRIIIGAVYKFMDETIEFLWDKELQINTVHVRDVCAAAWHLCLNGTVGEVYNLCDATNTTQGSVGTILEGIFKVKCSFLGTLKSKVFTSVAMKTVAEAANEKHLKPWSDLCKEQTITNTPLTPYLDEELLYDNALCIDGTKITKSGFKYEHPKMTQELVQEVVDYFVDLAAFPKTVNAAKKA